MRLKIFVLAVALSLLTLNAAAQSSAAPPAVQQQPTPPRSPQDLFAQVPAAKPEDVKSIDNAPPAIAIGIVFVPYLSPAPLSPPPEKIAKATSAFAPAPSKTTSKAQAATSPSTAFSKAPS
jgi:hypothetical protein